jgi:hypothetical protein
MNRENGDLVEVVGLSQSISFPKVYYPGFWVE